MSNAKNHAIEINRGTDLDMVVRWPANIAEGDDLTDWVFSIYDADSVTGMGDLTIYWNSGDGELSLFMPGESTGLLPKLSRFRIKGISPGGISYTTNRIDIRIT